jgi:hypothetical protein
MMERLRWLKKGRRANGTIMRRQTQKLIKRKNAVDLDFEIKQVLWMSLLRYPQQSSLM